MNGRRLLELWRKGGSRLLTFFGTSRASGGGRGGQQQPAIRTSLIVATAQPGGPNGSVGGLIAKLLETKKSTILLTGIDELPPGVTSKTKMFRGGGAKNREDVYNGIGSDLRDRQVRRIFAIPQSSQDLLNAIAACDITGAPLAVCVTEGNDFHTDRSKSDLLHEALRKARLCFAASEPLRAEIQKRYGKKVWIFPPLNSGRDTQNERLSEVPSPELLTGLAEWIWKSLEAGSPADDRFEQLFSRVRDRLTPYVDPPAPREIHWEMEPHYQALCRLRASYYKPDFVVDVGASTGYWSHIATKIFPSCRYFLIEPLLEKYLEAEGTIYRLHPEFIQVKAAAGNVAGELEMNVSPDLYGSSFFDSSSSADGSSRQIVPVKIRTLDEIACTEGIKGRGLLKIDVQFSEHLVLDGATNFLKQVDVIFLEVSLRRFVPECKTFVEIMIQLHGLGFEYTDYAGTWRDSATGELLQQDVVFARPKLPGPESV
jgi:FkbM family methyltransferase